MAARTRLQAISSGSADPFVLYALGYGWYRESMLTQKGKRRAAALDSAEATLRRATRLGKIPEAHALLATVIGQQIGKSVLKGMLLSGRVRAELERARALGPDNPRVALQDAIVAFHTPARYGGGNDRAAAALERALTLFAQASPSTSGVEWGEAETWAYLGRVHAQRADTAAAREAYARALQIDPYYAWVARVLIPALNKK